MSHDREPLTVFSVEGTYYFAHYFERRDLFRKVSEYYDDDHYRFEVPEDEWPAVLETLEEHRYAPRIVEDVEPYCVVTRKYDEHANVLRDSIMHWERRDHRFFVMKDDLAVESAIEAGATPVEGTDFEVGI